MAETEPDTVVLIEEGHATSGAEQHIDPWNVSGGIDAEGNPLPIDYSILVTKWKTRLIDDELLQRFERLTGHKPHRWLRRRLFFSHREFGTILDKYEHGEPFFLYTGRGPSSDALHLGHTIPMSFAKWLQDVFDCPLVIMLTDDEKAMFQPSLMFESTHRFGLQNAADIIACGFDVKKTFIYSDLEFLGGHFLMNVWEFSKAIPFNQVRGAFGFDDSTHIGRILFPAVQCSAAFATSYPHIWHDWNKSELLREWRELEQTSLTRALTNPEADALEGLVRELGEWKRVDSKGLRNELTESEAKRVDVLLGELEKWDKKQEQARKAMEQNDLQSLIDEEEKAEHLQQKETVGPLSKEETKELEKFKKKKKYWKPSRLKKPAEDKAPNPAGPKTGESNLEDPKVEDPKVEASKVDQTEVAEPKNEQSNVAVSNVQQSKAEEPKAEESKKREEVKQSDEWDESPTYEFNPLAATRSARVARIPCLIPMAIDQDPYFRLLKNNCYKMKRPSPKPAMIHSKFLTALQGAGGKMSASNPNSAIFMADSPDTIKTKINRHAFSGGRETLEEHRRLGGIPEVDVAFQYLSYFEDDDDKLKQIEDSYRKGELLTGELKKMAIDLITQYVVEFQVRRSDVTDAVVRQFMTPRKLEWKGNPNPKPRPKVEPPTPAEGKSKKSKKGKKGDTNANHTVQSQGGAENSAANPAAPETVAKS